MIFTERVTVLRYLIGKRIDFYTGSSYILFIYSRASFRFRNAIQRTRVLVIDNSNRSWQRHCLTVHFGLMYVGMQKIAVLFSLSCIIASVVLEIDSIMLCALWYWKGILFSVNWRSSSFVLYLQFHWPRQVLTQVTMSILLLNILSNCSIHKNYLQHWSFTETLFLNIQVPDQILIDRCIGRRLDPVTGKIYHLKFFPPESEEIKARLVTRSDDTEEKVWLQTFAIQIHCSYLITHLLFSLDAWCCDCLLGANWIWWCFYLNKSFYYRDWVSLKQKIKHLIHGCNKLELNCTFCFP